MLASPTRQTFAFSSLRTELPSARGGAHDVPQEDVEEDQPLGASDDEGAPPLAATFDDDDDDQFVPRHQDEIDAEACEAPPEKPGGVPTGFLSRVMAAADRDSDRLRREREERKKLEEEAQEAARRAEEITTLQRRREKERQQLHAAERLALGARETARRADVVTEADEERTELLEDEEESRTLQEEADVERALQKRISTATRAQAAGEDCTGLLGQLREQVIQQELRQKEAEQRRENLMDRRRRRLRRIKAREEQVQKEGDEVLAAREAARRAAEVHYGVFAFVRIRSTTQADDMMKHIEEEEAAAQRRRQESASAYEAKLRGKGPAKEKPGKRQSTWDRWDSSSDDDGAPPLSSAPEPAPMPAHSAPAPGKQNEWDGWDSD